ncbi:MAG: hypothetical protein HYT65_00275 [Candidatus Yanofskybacteria bacterium]|nr:hypothetical protein [Candidatus Yanofskybacteria bacterium]
MKKRTRKILFYFSVLVFIILSFLLVLFALGYKYDFVQNKFFSTGSLELKTNVTAEVYINDELAGSTSFLSDSFSKGRLLPRTYNVRLQNEKYQSWHKLVNVEAGFLSSFPRVVLLPQDFESEVVASGSIRVLTIRRFEPENNLAVLGNKQKLESINLKNGEIKPMKTSSPTPLPSASSVENGIAFIASPDGNKNAWFNERELWVKWVKNSNYQPYKLAGDIGLVTRFSQKIEDAQWYKDSEHLIVNVGGILKFIEIDDRGGINIFDIATITGPFYYDRDQDAIFKFEGNKLVRINLSE